MSIRSELLAIQARHKGILRVEDVHAWAKRHTHSALHRRIEWDRDKAAFEFQLWQIRRLIVLNIVSEDGTPQIVSLTFDRTGPGGGYRSISDVLESKELSAIMLADAITDLERVRERYRMVRELTSVWDALDKVKIKRKPSAASRKRTAAR